MEMSKPRSRKHSRKCIVPKCVNTMVNVPEKLFFLVPREPKMRMKWIDVMRMAGQFGPVICGPKSSLFCCEDHFDVENDMENFMRYKLMGGQKRLKQGVVPHKFECQKRNYNKPGRSECRKRREMGFFEEVFIQDVNPAMSVSPVEVCVTYYEDERMEDPLDLEINDTCLERFKHHDKILGKFKYKMHYKTISIEEKDIVRKKKKS